MDGFEKGPQRPKGGFASVPQASFSEGEHVMALEMFVFMELFHDFAKEFWPRLKQDDARNVAWTPKLHQRCLDTRAAVVPPVVARWQHPTV